MTVKSSMTDLRFKMPEVVVMVVVKDEAPDVDPILAELALDSLVTMLDSESFRLRIGR